MSDVQLKRKVTLKEKKVTNLDGANPGTQKSKIWLWVIIGLIVVAAIVTLIVLLKPNSDKQGIKGEEPTIEQTEQQHSDAEVAVTGVGDDADVASETPTTTDESTSGNVENDEVAPANRTAQPKPQQPATEPASPKLSSMSTASNAGLTGDVEKDALNAIRGDFGNGQARKEALGDRYAEIQNRVNEIYKERGLL